MSSKTKKANLSSPRSDDNNPNRKPPFTYLQLIIQAISTAPERQEKGLFCQLYMCCVQVGQFSLNLGAIWVQSLHRTLEQKVTIPSSH